MILLLDTSTPECRVSLVDGSWRVDDVWQADRQLAKGLLGYLQNTLHAQGKSWDDITGIGVYKGPGSFTGLRIGLTVLNTLADTKQIPIVGSTGETWQKDALASLAAGQNDKLVMPLYGSEANITKPRK